MQLPSVFVYTVGERWAQLPSVSGSPVGTNPATPISMPGSDHSDKTKRSPDISTEAAPDLRERVAKGRRGRWWHRKGSARRGFYYTDHLGKRITDETQIERIRSLAIPPAWRFVRICPASAGRLQAVGVDLADRLQYIYHPDFARRQQQKKYAKVLRFAKMLPRLRQATSTHIRQKEMTRERVTAVVIRLMNSLYIRVGSVRNARRHRTYGATTLQRRHLKVEPKGKLVFSFRGKGGIKHRIIHVDHTLARIISELRSNSGNSPFLFHYTSEDGTVRRVTSRDVNDYLKEVTAPEFSVKDLRTWGATRLAAIELASRGPAEDEKGAEKAIREVICSVAEKLGNTPAVCRSAYIHPDVLDAYREGVLIDKALSNGTVKSAGPRLDQTEKALLRLLERYQNNGRRPSRS